MATQLLAQQVSSLVANGKIKDKENGYVLNTATVSLFDADSSLVSYQITNTYGNFSFKVDKIKYPCQLRISNVGYKIKTLEIKASSQSGIDFWEISLELQNISLKEVEIKISPITLNGDTLEFNPAAFKLDSNAVLEDLLRKIPNVTVWNDGQITVNGREIKSLVVNNKPFFGTDFKVITGNLPNNIISKIQVYRKDDGAINPIDSIMEMNIQLKKGMDKGFFGKLSAALGTKNRNEMEGNINYFTKKFKLSLAGTANNTNKIANDMQTLLRNSTYKGNITDLEYQSNFRLPGINSVRNVGANVHYDFLESTTPSLKNEFSASYFRQQLKVTEFSEGNSLRTLSSNEQNNTSDEIFNKSKAHNEQINLKYFFKNDISALTVYAQRRTLLEEGNRTLSTIVIDQNQKVLSSYKGSDQNDFATSKHSVSAYYSYSPQQASSEVKRKQFLPFDLSYLASVSHVDKTSAVNTAFISSTNPADNIDFDRTKISERRLDNQQIDLVFRNLNRLMSGKQSSTFDLSLIGNLDLNSDKDDELVSDGIGSNLKVNSYLSNSSIETVHKLYYGLGISKFYKKQLTDRFDNSLSLTFKPRIMNISYTNKSQKATQLINKRSTSFYPSIDLSLYRNIFGKHRTGFNASYLTEINFPNLQSLAPLVDSTMIYNLRMGNLNLSQEKIQSFQLSFSREYTQRVNTFVYNLNAAMSVADDKIVDSILLSKDNRQTIFPINSGAYKQYVIGANLKKSFKFKSSDVKLRLAGEITRTDMPMYINADFVLNVQKFSNLSADIGYGYKDLVVLEYKENVTHYQSEQSFFSRIYKGTTFTHTVNALFQFTKSFNINSNINFNVNRSANFPVSRFTIWNVYVSKRLFKRQNAELKFSGLDLLNQNRNVVNSIALNGFSTTTRNSLQRYFLFSLSYFPRQFSK